MKKTITIVLDGDKDNFNEDCLNDFVEGLREAIGEDLANYEIGLDLTTIEVK